MFSKSEISQRGEKQEFIADLFSVLKKLDKIADTKDELMSHLFTESRGNGQGWN